MGYADVRFCLRRSKRSRSYGEGSIELKIASAKPTLRASPAFAHTVLSLLDVATAMPAKRCLVWTKAGDVVGMTCY